ncbi:hypothetical protein C8Q75DRAFT_731515 [Abortiporus biennis]|nr:hypothetical protein C8Q75DRAFT_731515 [Abortiporus biennis]
MTISGHYADEHPNGKFLQLPQELVDNVIDFLWNDKKSLLATSTASPIFTKSSHYHLFSQMTVDGSHLEYDFSNFLAFLLRRPNVCIYIRVLSLKLMCRGKLYPKSGRWRTTPTFIVYEILEKLLRLNHLILRGLTIKPLRSDASTTLLRSSFKLCALEIHNVEFLGVKAVYEVFGLFSAVRSLELENCSLRPISCDHTNDSMDLKTCSGPSIIIQISSATMQTMASNGDLTICVLQLLRHSTRSTPTSSLRSLHIKHSSVDGIIAFGSLLRNGGNSLEELSIRVSAIMDTLQRWSIVLDILSRITPDLRNAILVMKIQSGHKQSMGGDLQYLDWSYFDHVLHRFRQLEYVEVRCDSTEKAKDIERIFASRAFRPHVQKIFRVTP